MRKFSHRTLIVELSTANERLLLADSRISPTGREPMFWSRGQALALTTLGGRGGDPVEARDSRKCGCCLWQATIEVFR